MAKSRFSLTQPRAGEIGEPQRKWYIIPRVIPVPPPLEREPLPERAPAEVPEREPERVPA